MKKTFSIKALFNQSFEDYKKNWGLFVLATLVIFLASMIGSFSELSHQASGGFFTFGGGIINILATLLGIFLQLGLMKMLFNLVDGKEYKLEDLFNGPNSWRHYLYFAVASILYSALVGFGMLFLVIPGLIMMVGFLFVQYLVAEEKAGIFESFKISWKMTAGNRWKIFWFLILIILFNILGALALLIGLFITIPITYIVSVRLYRALLLDTPEKQEFVVIEEEIIIETVEDKKEDE